jgi:lipopolysaccharide transport system ATP-binding protein
MSDSIIQVRGLGKSYNISNEKGKESYTALRDVINNQAKKIFSFPKSLRNEGGLKKFNTEEFWALKDVSFDIKQGDRVGIIGRNGAGKSTLLKLLSRITEPTAGEIRIKGRVASLLEVGTGFHPELTGRENIYLNGAILGMSRAEIKSKFDEIVDFAEVEQFLDTPVKRYSSGMYVKLAFAVAAHLEPEILVVDEVLAVGDAQFQKKCMGKMEDMSKNEGRTVLFVSHNIGAIQVLTNLGILLNKGLIEYTGDVTKCIQIYNSNTNNKSDFEFIGKGKHSRILTLKLIDKKDSNTNLYSIGDVLKFKCTIETDGTPNLSIELFLYDNITQNKIGMFSLYQFCGKTLESKIGTQEFIIEIIPLNLASGIYRIEAKTSIVNVAWDHVVESACVFEVLFSNFNNSTYDYKASFNFGNIALLPY